MLIRIYILIYIDKANVLGQNYNFSSTHWHQTIITAKLSQCKFPAEKGRRYKEPDIAWCKEINFVQKISQTDSL
jgi:hypothetical protein